MLSPRTSSAETLDERLSTNTFESCALEEILATGEGEKKLLVAILNVDVDKESYPLVKVVSDGAWSTGSFKTSYSSLSGCACALYYWL
ncbi:unnamed protein product, partial [Brenthis ino]